jgi:hypothetical protein
MRGQRSRCLAVVCSLLVVSCTGGSVPRSYSVVTQEWATATGSIVSASLVKGSPHDHVDLGDVDQRLFSVSNAALALSLFGHAVGDLNELYDTFWSQGSGLYTTANEPIPDNVVTWLVLMSMSGSPTDWAAFLVKHGTEARGQLAHRMSMANDDVFDRLYDVRIAHLLGVSIDGAKVVDYYCELAQSAKGSTWIDYWSAFAEMIGDAQIPCDVPPEAPDWISHQWEGVRADLESPEPFNILSAENLRELTVLASRPETAEPRIEVLLDLASSRAANGSVAGNVETLATLGMALRQGGREATLASELAAFLSDVVRRGASDPAGTSPESYGMALHMLVLAGLAEVAENSVASIQWAGGGLNPYDEVTLRLLVDPRSIRQGHVQALTGDHEMRPGSFEVGLLANLVLSRPDLCGDDLRFGLEQASLEVEKELLVVAHLGVDQIFRAARLLKALDSCDISLASRESLVENLTAALNTATTASGLHSAVPELGIIEPVSSLRLLEAACILGAPVSVDPSLASTQLAPYALQSGGAGYDPHSISIEATYALLRIDMIASYGCMGALWQGLPR